MMRYALFLLLLLAVVKTVSSAALIPYYQMDSLAYLSSDIVLCDEVRCVKKGSWGGHEVTYTVVQTLKGGCQPKETLTVNMDGIYTRCFASVGSQFRVPTSLAKGRALLFLIKEGEVWRPRSGGVKIVPLWRPVLGGVKHIINGETYCYGQFLSNPGPLWLARMRPENLAAPSKEPYDEARLLEDLRLAQEKAKSLTGAVVEYGGPGEAVSRTDD